LAVVVVLALVVGGLLWWRADTSEQAHGQTLIVGDSVTFMSTADIEARFGGTSEVEVEGHPGDTSAQLLPVLEGQMRDRRARGESLDRLGVLVGYNDVVRRLEDPQYLAKMVALAGEFRCAVFLTVPVPAAGSLWARTYGTTGFPPFNQRLAKLVAATPHVHLSRRWQHHVQGSAPGTLVSGDGVHPREAGQKVLADDYAAALDEAC
jgi:lysophospholipase L1-like esterase